MWQETLNAEIAATVAANLSVAVPDVNIQANHETVAQMKANHYFMIMIQFRSLEIKVFQISKQHTFVPHQQVLLKFIQNKSDTVCISYLTPSLVGRSVTQGTELRISGKNVKLPSLYVRPSIPRLIKLNSSLPRFTKFISSLENSKSSPTQTFYHRSFPDEATALLHPHKLLP